MTRLIAPSTLHTCTPQRRSWGRLVAQLLALPLLAVCVDEPVPISKGRSWVKAQVLSVESARRNPGFVLVARFSVPESGMRPTWGALR